MNIFKDQKVRLHKLQGQRTILDLAKKQLKDYIEERLSDLPNVRVSVVYTGMSSYREGDGLKYMRVTLRCLSLVSQFECTDLDHRQLNNAIRSYSRGLSNATNI